MFELYAALLKGGGFKHDVRGVSWSCGISRQGFLSRISYAVCHLIFSELFALLDVSHRQSSAALNISTNETAGVFIHAALPFAIAVSKVGRAAQCSVHRLMSTMRLKGLATKSWLL